MPQRYGTASSYAKKYALGNLFLIDDTADADATNKTENNWVPEAKEYLKKGGSLEKIKKKYTLTPEIEQELSTL